MSNVYSDTRAADAALDGPRDDGPTGAAGEIDRVMDRYARGDDAAFGELYDLLAPRLMGYLRRLVRDPSGVEDLAQATLLQIHRARGTFIRGAAVVPWAFAIARRLVVDDYRKQRRAPPITFDDDGLVTALTPDASPLARAEARQLAAILERALEALPEAQRTAFRVLRIEGLSVAEAADLLGTTEAGVKLRAHRAYEALRKCIDKRYPVRT